MVRAILFRGVIVFNNFLVAARLATPGRPGPPTRQTARIKQNTQSIRWLLGAKRRRSVADTRIVAQLSLLTAFHGRNPKRNAFLSKLRFVHRADRRRLVLVLQQMAALMLA